MKMNFNTCLASLLLLGTTSFFAACNKDAEDPVPVEVVAPAGRTLNDTLTNDAGLTILKAAIARASTSSASPSLSALLSDRSAEFTFFAPTDAAFQSAFALLGIPSAAGINAFRPGQLDTILRYHIVPGKVMSASFARAFPSVQLPTQFVLQAPSAAVPPGLRMSVFGSKNVNTSWVNNVPVIQADQTMANGVVHKIAAVLLPPSQFLWDRINTDANLTYLKAAIQRADSGATASTSLVAALQNPGASLTVFAPVDTAFRSAITGLIAQGLIGQGVPPATAATQAAALAATPAVFSNPALYSSLTAQMVQGVVVYHLFGNRAFTVNFPTTSTGNFPTLLNAAVPLHPGVALQATFGATGVASASVKGQSNTSASTLFINPTPAPNGTSDQHYINGVLHYINQVLRP